MGLRARPLYPRRANAPRSFSQKTFASNSASDGASGDSRLREWNRNDTAEEDDSKSRPFGICHSKLATNCVRGTIVRCHLIS